MLKLTAAKRIGSIDYDVLSLTIGGWNLSARRLELRMGLAQEEADRVRVGKDGFNGIPSPAPLFATITIKSEVPDPVIDALFAGLARYIEEEIEPVLVASGYLDDLVFELGEEQLELSCTHTVSGKPYQNETQDEQQAKLWVRAVTQEAQAMESAWRVTTEEQERENARQ